MNYTIEITNTENTNFRVLEQKLDNELYKIYGEMQSNYSSQNIVKDLKTIIIYKNENPIACGCLKLINYGLAEVKRVFVSLENRGKGISKIVVKEIEKLAEENNVKELVLQTGVKQKAAINLYKVMGYKLIENYGPYIGDGNSICMKKVL
jgi:GNAT superfamily N-acetyltransferase